MENSLTLSITSWILTVPISIPKYEKIGQDHQDKLSLEELLMDGMLMDGQTVEDGCQRRFRPHPLEKLCWLSHSSANKLTWFGLTWFVGPFWRIHVHLVLMILTRSLVASECSCGISVCVAVTAAQHTEKTRKIPVCADWWWHISACIYVTRILLSWRRLP